MNKKNNIGAVVASVAVGAAAGAAALALTDKENRKKLVKTVGELTNKAQQMAGDVSRNPEVKKAIRKSKPMLKNAKRRVAMAA